MLTVQIWWMAGGDFSPSSLLSFFDLLLGLDFFGGDELMCLE